MKELNGKLAEWAGFRHSTYHDEEHPSREYHCWILPGATTAYITDHEMPNFTESLDACNKWLIPKLTYCCLVKPEHPSYEGQWGAMVRTKGGDASVYDKEAALALCLAIEKLIDGEVK